MTSRVAAAALIGLSIVYLGLFVSRGWIPHDEGMIGQSAERVLRGEIPHVDYQEPYTGGLTWMHAMVFRLAGIDLLYPRWLLFAAAVLAQLLVYLILRRYLQPVGAALASWLALGWGFPNYFAALPSWWLLVCALMCAWSVVKYVETALLRYAAIAGLAAGASILIKQTGLYLLVALVMALLYSGGTDEDRTERWWPARVVCAVVAIAAVGLAVMILAARPAPAELLYLLLPIVACSGILLATDARHSSGQTWRALAAPAVAVCVAAVPLVCFLLPYLINRQIATLVNGVFILPQKRVQFAAMAMPPAHWLLAGLPLIAAVMPLPLPAFLRVRALNHLVGAIVGIAGAVLLITSLSDMASYQLLWQSARGFAALLPVAVCGVLLSGHARDVPERKRLFALATFLAWASLVQVPFSAPIYFCYAAPLAVVAGVALAGHTRALSRPVVGAAAVVMLAFALVSMNRGYVYNLGMVHQPSTYTTPLALERAHLYVSREDAVSYRRVMRLINRHIGNGKLVAGPDAPEVYFLAGRFSQSGSIFDFFADQSSVEGGLSDMRGLVEASVVVINHRTQFSAGPSAELADKVRRVFPKSENVGTLEVRWR
jgi:hypothetical protein